MLDFENKVALITGTTGIALATARRLAQGGASIVACGIERAANAAMQESLAKAGSNALVQTVDVSVADEVREAVAAGVAKFGGIDVIVNSAAVHPYGTATTTDWETWNRAMTVNVGSIYLTAHFGIPEMIKRGGGAIVNVASVQGFACQQNVAAYATTKGAIHTLTRSLALGYAASGIRVNSVSPG
ncbi:SDR family oxidoreductase, partial [Mesorhizobium sp. M8A.F.Ca.ET.059.01.1.1]